MSESTKLYDIDGNELFEGDIVINLNCVYDPDEVEAVKKGAMPSDELAVSAIERALWDSTEWTACGTGVKGITSHPRYGLKLVRRGAQ